MPARDPRSIAAAGTPTKVDRFTGRGHEVAAAISQADWRPSLDDVAVRPHDPILNAIGHHDGAVPSIWSQNTCQESAIALLRRWQKVRGAGSQSDGQHHRKWDGAIARTHGMSIAGTPGRVKVTGRPGGRRFGGDIA